MTQRARELSKLPAPSVHSPLCSHGVGNECTPEWLHSHGIGLASRRLDPAGGTYLIKRFRSSVRVLRAATLSTQIQTPGQSRSRWCLPGENSKRSTVGRSWTRPHMPLAPRHRKDVPLESPVRG